MAHMVKCLICGKTFDRDKEPWVKPRTNRYAHKTCVNSDKLQSITDEDQFFQMVKSIYGKDYNYIMIHQQAINYINQYGYTWSGMTGCLHWFYNINHGSIEEGHGGIGIIPFIYEDVKKYYQNIYQSQEINKKKKIRAPVYNITIQSPKIYKQPPHLLNLGDEDE